MFFYRAAKAAGAGFTQAAKDAADGLSEIAEFNVPLRHAAEKRTI